jgi:hypothetical protein
LNLGRSTTDRRRDLDLAGLAGLAASARAAGRRSS